MDNLHYLLIIIIKDFRDQMQEITSVKKNKDDKSILLNPTNPYFSLIWLHGLGDSSQGFLGFFQDEHSPVSRGCRVKLLNAPRRKVSINGGGLYTSWYDIYNLSPQGTNKQRFNIQQVKDSLKIIQQHITEQISYWKGKGVSGSDEQICKRIFIGGFSQGCAMSLCYGLTSNRLLGGVIGYSGHLFQGLQFKNIDKISMLVYHGDSDPVLNFNWVKPGYEKYLKPHKNFQFILVKGLKHSIEIQQLIKTTSWILQQLEKNSIKFS